MKRQMTKADFQRLAAFRYALRCFTHFSENTARTLGLEPQQHQALLALEGYPGNESPTLGALAEQLQIRHHSAVGLVDRLVKLGYISRNKSMMDRRRVNVVLTPRGKKILSQLSDVHLSELSRIGPQLKVLLAGLSRQGDQLPVITTTE